MANLSDDALGRIPVSPYSGTAHRAVLRGQDPVSIRGSQSSAGRSNLAGEPTLYMGSEAITAAGESTRHARDRFLAFRELTGSIPTEELVDRIDHMLGEYLTSRDIYPMETYLSRVADLRDLSIVDIDEEEYLQEPRETLDPSDPQGWATGGYISQVLASRIRTSWIEVEGMLVPSALGWVSRLSSSMTIASLVPI